MIVGLTQTGPDPYIFPKIIPLNNDTPFARAHVQVLLGGVRNYML